MLDLSVNAILYLLLLFIPFSQCIIDQEAARRAIDGQMSKEKLAKDVSACLDSDVKTNSKSCELTMYLDDFVRIKSAMVDPISEGTKLSRPQAISTVDEAFHALFENYMIPKKPFKQGMVSSSNVSVEFCLADHDAFRNRVNEASHDVALRKCEPARLKQLFSHVTIPIIAAGSYLNRLQPMAPDANVIDHAGQWPAVVPLPNDGRWSVVQQCPLNMHMVLWGAERDIDVRIFLKAVSSRLSPKMSRSDGLFPHYVTYGDLTDVPSSDLPKYSETVLKQKEFLFVPNTYLAQFRTASDSTIDGTMLRLCLVDASNYQEVRSAVATEARLSVSTGQLLRSLYSTEFNSAMVRNPKELKTMDAFDSVKHDAAEIEQEDGSTKATDGKDKNKRRRRNKGGSNFKAWQSDSMWTSLINSLTLPEAPRPRVKHVGRGNVSIIWDGNFNPPSSDTSLYGYNLTVCPDDGTAIEAQSETCKVFSVLRGELLHEKVDLKRTAMTGEQMMILSATLGPLDPGSNYRLRSQLIHGLTSSNPSPWSSAFKTAALTVPAPITTGAMARRGEDPLSIRIEFGTPGDDGGSQILGYHVFKQYRDATGSTHDLHAPVWIGDYQSVNEEMDPKVALVLGPFSPETLVEIYVAAFNAIGSAPMVRSNPISVSTVSMRRAERVVTTVTGRGTGSHRPVVGLPMDASKEERQQYFKNHQYGHASMLEASSHAVHLNAKDEVISFGSSKVDVWRSYWSVKGHSVESEVVWMDSSLPSKEMMDQLHDRIALAPRNGEVFVSMALKAQKAGALALVIVDDGSCTSFDQICIPGADKSFDEGFAIRDDPKRWHMVRIPVVFTLREPILEFLKDCYLAATPDFALLAPDKWSILERRLGKRRPVATMEPHTDPTDEL